MSVETLRDGLLFGMGNPLLDIQGKVDKSFLDKWGLKEDDQILCDEKLVPMFHELTERSDIEYIAGGATQNALRIAQWVLGKPNVATFMGCIGDDKFGTILQQEMKKAGVRAVYQISKKEKTGTCACCIYQQYRSLCAHLAAANCFTKDHLANPEHRGLMEQAQFYYIAGFFLTVCPDAIQEVAEHALANNKTFMMNLSAPFLVQFFKEPMMNALPYVDIIFGNENEALTFAKEHDFQTTDIKEIALKLSALPRKNPKGSRIAVITQGADPVVIAQDGKVTEHPIIALKKEEIIDTNGAGDAWVGGFLSQYVQGRPLEEAVRCANFCANTIIQRSGVTLPEKCEFK